MSATASFTSEIPSEADARLAGKTRLLLTPLIDDLPQEAESLPLTAEETIQLPRAAIRLLAQILDEMSRGNAVKVIPVHAELTTQEAADLLNVSRPTLIQMLESGALPFRKVGTHRRIRVDTLMAHERKLDAERIAALTELSAYDQQIGL